eukprot:2061461-Amphidinium_carterae.1
MEVPGAPAPPTPVQVTGQRDSSREASPGRGSPPAPEQGLLADLRSPRATELPAVAETPDEEMDDVNGEPPNPARKRIHAALD